MKQFTKMILATTALGVACVGFAGEENKHVIAIGVNGDGVTDEVSLRINSEDLGFELDEMQIGESRSVVDESGRAVLITRSESGFSFNVDGKTIELPDFANIDGEDFDWVTEDDEADLNVHVIRKPLTAKLADTSATVIISPKSIDEATRKSIQSILETGGYGSDVEFIEHGAASDGHVFIKQFEKVVGTTL